MSRVTEASFEQLEMFTEKGRAVRWYTHKGRVYAVGARLNEGVLNRAREGVQTKRGEGKG